MTVGQLVQYLREYPLDAEVLIEPNLCRHGTIKVTKLSFSDVILRGIEHSGVSCVFAVAAFIDIKANTEHKGNNT